MTTFPSNDQLNAALQAEPARRSFGQVLSAAAPAVVGVQPKTGIGGFLKGLILGAGGAQAQAQQQEAAAAERASKALTNNLSHERLQLQRAKLAAETEERLLEVQRRSMVNPVIAQVAGLTDLPAGFLELIPTDELMSIGRLKGQGAQNDLLVGLLAGGVGRTSRDIAHSERRDAESAVEDAGQYTLANIIADDKKSRGTNYFANASLGFPIDETKPVITYNDDDMAAIDKWVADAPDQVTRGPREEVANKIRSASFARRQQYKDAVTQKKRARLREELAYPGRGPRWLFQADEYNLRYGGADASLGVQALEDFVSHDPVGQNVQSLAELHREFNKSLNSSGWLGFSPTPDELESLIKAASDRFPKFAQMEERATAKQEGRPPDRAVGSIIFPSGAQITPEQWDRYARQLGQDPDQLRKEWLRDNKIKMATSDGG